MDIIKEKVDKINNRISPIKDEYIEKYLKEKKLNLKATLDYKEALKGADFVVISTPTNYDVDTNYFAIGDLNEELLDKIAKITRVSFLTRWERATA